MVCVLVEAVQGGCCALSITPKSLQICGCLGGGDGVGVSSVWLGVGRDLGFVEVGSSWWPGDEHVNPQGLVAFGDVSPDPSKSPTRALGIILVRAWWWCGSLLHVGIGDLTCSGPQTSYKMKPGGFLPLGAKGTRGLPKSPGSPQTAGLSPAFRLLRFPSCWGHPRASTLGCPEPPTHQAAAGWVALGGVSCWRVPRSHRMSPSPPLGLLGEGSGCCGVGGGSREVTSRGGALWQGGDVGAPPAPGKERGEPDPGVTGEQERWERVLCPRCVGAAAAMELPR